MDAQTVSDDDDNVDDTSVPPPLTLPLIQREDVVIGDDEEPPRADDDFTEVGDENEHWECNDDDCQSPDVDTEADNDKTVDSVDGDDYSEQPSDDAYNADEPVDEGGDNDELQTASGVRQMPNVGWLPTTELLQLLNDPPIDIFHLRVPVGLKSNVFCVLDNRDNAERRGRGERRAFDDDCGAWSMRGGSYRGDAIPRVR